MDKNFGDARGMRRLREREQMLVVAVHAPVRNQAEQMQPMAARCGERLLQDLDSDRGRRQRSPC